MNHRETKRLKQELIELFRAGKSRDDIYKIAHRRAGWGRGYVGTILRDKTPAEWQRAKENAKSEVVAMVENGMTLEEAAANSGKSIHTVRSYVRTDRGKDFQIPKSRSLLVKVPKGRSIAVLGALLRGEIGSEIARRQSVTRQYVSLIRKAGEREGILEAKEKSE